MDEELKRWANENSAFLKLADGESVTAIYGGWEKGEYKGNVRFNYKINDKLLSSTSVNLAHQFAEVPKGARIKIERRGLGPDTRYLITRIKEIETSVQQPIMEPMKDEQVTEEEIKEIWEE